MFSIRTVLALAALLAVSAEDATEDAPAAAAVEYAEVTTLFRAAETDVLRFRHSRDPRGKGNDTHLVSALAKYEELQARADFTSSLDEQTRVLVLDSCEFCSRKLVQHEGALKYAKALADSRLCRLDADGCFASVASRIVLRLRALGRTDDATDYFNTAMAVAPAADSSGDDTLLHWTSQWQMPAWYIPNLTAKPWWEDPDSEPASLKDVRDVMQHHFADIQGELIRLATLAARMERDGVGQLFELQMVAICIEIDIFHLINMMDFVFKNGDFNTNTKDFDLVADGEWSEYLLYDDGQWFDHRCELVPTTCQAMSSIAAVAGVVEGVDEAQAPGQVTILRMAGSTTLSPHCGPRNSRLTAHLPLVVPEIEEPVVAGERVGLRVGEELGDDGDAWRQWEEGHLLIFDDSFEHEARWPEATEEAKKMMVGEYEDGEEGGARYVLYASIWHPDLGEPTLPVDRQWPSEELQARYRDEQDLEGDGGMGGASAADDGGGGRAKKGRKGKGNGKGKKRSKKPKKAEL